jgi:hypothetical protein
MDNPRFLCYNTQSNFMKARVLLMPLSFLPKAMIEQLSDLTPEWLHERGIRLLLMDFDNTIVPYTTNEPTETVRRWFARMQQSDVSLCVVSNSHRARVPDFCAAMGLDCVTAAKKPGIRGIRQALGNYHCAPSEAALVGDQIYTDVLGANRAGVFSILVRPISLHIFPLRVRNWAERPWIHLAKRRLSHDQS